MLVPNSMGGMVATQAAARCPERVASIVYVAAFLPQDGDSLLALTQLPEGADDQIQANLVVEGDPPVAVLSPEASLDAMYLQCSEQTADWAIDRQRPQPGAAVHPSPCRCPTERSTASRAATCSARATGRSRRPSSAG